jgi:hypothetical protein
MGSGQHKRGGSPGVDGRARGRRRSGQRKYMDVGCPAWDKAVMGSGVWGLARGRVSLAQRGLRLALFIRFKTNLFRFKYPVVAKLRLQLKLWGHI